MDWAILALLLVLVGVEGWRAWNYIQARRLPRDVPDVSLEEIPEELAERLAFTEWVVIGSGYSMVVGRHYGHKLTINFQDRQSFEEEREGVK
jgi:hypothetical protein